MMPNRLRPLLFSALLLSLLSNNAAAAPDQRYCGDNGVWLQILGAGGPELTDHQASASYVVWQDNVARLLVDTAPGSSVQFDKAGARIEDLDAIVFTHLHVDHSADFPAYIKGSFFAERTTPLKVFGPSGGGPYPDTTTFVERLIGPEGAYAYLADFLTFKSSGGYKVTATNVPSKGNRRWAKFRSDNIKLSAIPVNHGPVPAIAWRVEIGGHAIVFSGDFNNEKNVLGKFAKDADALVIHHAIPESARGTARKLHVTPSQIGRIAATANPRMVVLGHRMSRTRGVESLSREKIEENYTGSLIFANDMECWGL